MPKLKYFFFHNYVAFSIIVLMITIVSACSDSSEEKVFSILEFDLNAAEDNWNTRIKNLVESGDIIQKNRDFFGMVLDLDSVILPLNLRFNYNKNKLNRYVELSLLQDSVCEMGLKRNKQKRFYRDSSDYKWRKSIAAMPVAIIKVKTFENYLFQRLGNPDSVYYTKFHKENTDKKSDNSKYQLDELFYSLDDAIIDLRNGKSSSITKDISDYKKLIWYKNDDFLIEFKIGESYKAVTFCEEIEVVNQASLSLIHRNFSGEIEKPKIDSEYKANEIVEFELTKPDYFQDEETGEYFVRHYISYITRKLTPFETRQVKSLKFDITYIDGFGDVLFTYEDYVLNIERKISIGQGFIRYGKIDLHIPYDDIMKLVKSKDIDFKVNLKRLKFDDGKVIE